MGLLYRYEFKNTLRFMLVLLACALLASFVIQYTVSREDFFRGGPDSVTDVRFFLVILSALVFGGAAVTFFFYVSGLLSKDVFTDRGYLTMTLPLTGYQTVGARTLLAVTWFIILFAVGISFNLGLIKLLFPAEFAARFYQGLFASVPPHFWLRYIGIALVHFLLQVQLIFLSIILAKMTVSRYRLSGLWFIIFLLLSGIYEWVAMRVFPASGSMPLSFLVSGLGIFGSWGDWLQILGFNVIMAAILFILNSVLFEKKVEI